MRERERASEERARERERATERDLGTHDPEPLSDGKESVIVRYLKYPPPLVSRPCLAKHNKRDATSCGRGKEAKRK